jgi:hypothetical protein
MGFYVLPRAEHKAAATYIKDREKIHVKATRIKKQCGRIVLITTQPLMDSGATTIRKKTWTSS